MFNWVSGYWVIGILSALIALAFFWPQNDTLLNEVDRLNTPNQYRNETQAIEKKEYNGKKNTPSNRSNSFSREDDNARLKAFQEMDAQDRKVAALLHEAQKLSDNQFYTLPKERNAILVYREVLALVPNSSAAQQGIDTVSEKIRGIAERALKANKLSTANRSLQKLIDIDQESEHTINLTNAISRWHEKKKITDLVYAGDEAFHRQDYIAPATKNALYYYEQTLREAPNNTDAKAGINKIINIYRQRVQSSIDAQQYNQASTNLEILIEIDANDLIVPLFRQSINDGLEAIQ